MENKKLFDYNIFLIGFMGCGKSTIAGYLHDTFSMDVVEMDDIIAKREGMSISDIFETHGEQYFRDLETNLLVEMQNKSNVVISCGGGTPMRENNVLEMKKNGRVVLLTAQPETVLQRVKDNHDRPLLENNKNVCIAADSLSTFLAPKYLETTTPAPVAKPWKKAINKLIIGVLAPTAAKAALPT